MGRDKLLEAVEWAGGQSALARLIGVQQPHVWNWIHRDKKLPLERAVAIERVTGGLVTAASLRPDTH